MKFLLCFSNNNSILMILKILFTLQVIFVVKVLCSIMNYQPGDSYQTKRDKIIKNETESRFGSELLNSFSDNERKVNRLVTIYKSDEIIKALANPTESPVTMHFFQAKPLIEQSDIFKLIRKLPKGALLHGHNTAMVSSEWLLKNVTYRRGLNMCLGPDNQILLTFKNESQFCTSNSGVTPVADKRAAHGNVQQFDDELRKSFELFTTEPNLDLSNSTATWKKFQRLFSTVYDAIHYLPVFKDYHYQLMQELYDDNVMYAELRGTFSPVYDLENTYDVLKGVEIVQTVVEEFKRTHPDFIGLKLIYVCGRVPIAVLESKIETFLVLQERFPNFVIGFDLVGPEDFGLPLVDYHIQLEALANRTKLFLHAGETNWYGSKTDNNIIDAVLLNSHRIGHGFSLIKHPVLWQHVKKHKIPIEVNPISNQILNLVNDLRNHPASFYIAENLPVVISSDDPGFWRAYSLSHDFYYAFMAFSPLDGGLEILKQFVINSIMFSVLTDQERTDFMVVFERQWDQFLKEFLPKT